MANAPRSMPMDLTSAFLNALTPIPFPGLQLNPYTQVALEPTASEITFRLTAPSPRRGLIQTLVTPHPATEVYSLLLSVLTRGAVHFGLSGGSSLTEDLTAVGALLPLNELPAHPVFEATISHSDATLLGECAVADSISPESERLLAGCTRRDGPHPTWFYDAVRQIHWPLWPTSTQNDHTIPDALDNHSDTADAWKATVRRANASIADQGYGIVRGMLPLAVVRGFQRYYSQLIANGFLPSPDCKSKRYTFHNERLARWLHVHTASLLQQMIPEAIKPSYTYLSFYIEGAELERHVDREQCEYTLSLAIAASPYCDYREAWPLYLQLRNGTTTEVRLSVGDGVIFRGRTLPHYRCPLPEGRTSWAILLHYVPTSFAGSLD